MRDDKLYSISEAIDLTGASEFLLRTWELRYKVVRPKRTQSGRRLYSDKDLMRISKILFLTKHGFKISNLADLSLSELIKLELESNQTLSSYLPTQTSQQISAIKKVFTCMAAAEVDGIKSIFKAQRKALSSTDYIHKFIIPISQEMSRQSLSDSIDIIQEHLLSSFIKEHLYALTTDQKKSRKKQRLLFATLEGDYHELGILIAKSLAEAKGYESIYLGSHVPKKELAEACMRLKPTHVIIGTSVSTKKNAKDNLLKYIHFIDQHIPTETGLWLGGFTAQNSNISLKRPFHIFKTMEEYDLKLDSLSKERRNVKK